MLGAAIVDEYVKLPDENPSIGNILCKSKSDKIVDLSGIVVMRQVGGRKQAAVFDLRQVRKGNIEDPQLYGDDVIVVEQSGSKTAFRRFIESVPALGIFAWF